MTTPTQTWHLYTVRLISRLSDRNVIFEHVPATTARQAKVLARAMLSAPQIWLPVKATKEKPTNGA